MPSPGTLEIKFTPTEGNGEPMVFKIYEFLGGGVAMGMYNTDEVSICPRALSRLQALFIRPQRLF